MNRESTDGLWGGYADVRADLEPAPIPGTLAGVDGVDRPDIIVWAACARTRGAIVEAGYRQTVALIRAPGRDVFAPLRDHADLLQNAGRFVIAGGAPEFVEELGRRLGRHRVFLVRWPAGCEDACATIQQHGVQAVRDAIEGAEGFPIQGIHRPSADAMLRHRHAAPPPVLSTGCDATDSIMKFPGEGKLIVVSGIPNHGKSTWIVHVMAHTAVEHNRKWAVFSPEFGEWQHLAAQILAWKAQKPFRAFRGLSSMSDEEIADGAEWCGRHFAFLSCDAEDDAPTLEWLLERLRACVLRDGTTDFLIDPWNELEHQEDGRNETTYIGRTLQRLRAFAARHGVNAWIVAHPTKLRPFKPGEPIPVPTAYDINGGANWANKGDMILVVHCPANVTQIHLLKARFRRWGRRGSIAELEFDPLTGRFRSASVAQALRDPPPPDGDG